MRACTHSGYFLLPRFLSFPEDQIQALIFTMRLDLFVLLWVVAGVGIISRCRRHSAPQRLEPLPGHQD